MLCRENKHNIILDIIWLISDPIQRTNFGKVTFFFWLVCLLQLVVKYWVSWAEKGILISRPTLFTLICAARAKMSAHETTPGHSFSIAALAASITSKPRSVRFGMASFSEGESMSTDPSHPCKKINKKNNHVTNMHLELDLREQTALGRWQVAAQVHRWWCHHFYISKFIMFRPLYHMFFLQGAKLTKVPCATEVWNNRNEMGSCIGGNYLQHSSRSPSLQFGLELLNHS